MAPEDEQQHILQFVIPSDVSSRVKRCEQVEGPAFLQIANRSLTSPADRPATRTTFFRPEWPEAMVTEERGTSKRFAKNSMQAWLARPSSGGAVSANLSSSPSSPVMAFFFARDGS